jgi:hypothetical protein
MKAPDFIFRLDRNRRFLSGPSLDLDQILWGEGHKQSGIGRSNSFNVTSLELF